jgi:hypothetical protein
MYKSTLLLWVSENRALRKIFGPKREEVPGGWRRLRMRSFVACTLHQHQIKEDGMGGACSTDGRDKKMGKVILEWILGN